MLKFRFGLDEVQRGTVHSHIRQICGCLSEMIIGHIWQLITQGRQKVLSKSLNSKHQHMTEHTGVSFPFKISSQDLTGCHYCSALLDGSAEEWAIAVCNRHERDKEMEVSDTWPLKGNTSDTGINAMCFQFHVNACKSVHMHNNGDN